jgi:hypothetical protein
MIGSAVLGPLLACAYFLNGGVGQLMNPTPAASGGPPPGTMFIVTQGGANIITQGGSKFITQ